MEGFYLYLFFSDKNIDIGTGHKSNLVNKQHK